MEGINSKSRVITKRTYGLKSVQSLWNRLILDLNRASEAVGLTIERIRRIAQGLKVLIDSSCTFKRKSRKCFRKATSWVRLNRDVTTAEDRGDVSGRA